MKSSLAMSIAITILRCTCLLCLPLRVLNYYHYNSVHENPFHVMFPFFSPLRQKTSVKKNTGWKWFSFVKEDAVETNVRVLLAATLNTLPLKRGTKAVQYTHNVPLVSAAILRSRYRIPWFNCSVTVKSCVLLHRYTISRKIWMLDELMAYLKYLVNWNKESEIFMFMSITKFPVEVFVVQTGKNFDIQHRYNPVSILKFVIVLSDNPLRSERKWSVCAPRWCVLCGGLKVFGLGCSHIAFQSSFLLNYWIQQFDFFFAT